MNLAILAYGNTALTTRCGDITPDYPDLGELIHDMWQTMRNASGCGLAASQIGRTVRLFIVDSRTTYEHADEGYKQHYFHKTDTGIIETFINARIIKYSENYWEDEEGCLSIPNLLQKVQRSWSINIEYFDAKFEKHIKTFSGATARMIQHEYDHTNGVLYLDHLQPLTRKLMESKLKKIVKGQVVANYPLKFA